MLATQKWKKKKRKFSGIFGCLLTQNPIINELIKILNSLDSSRPYTSLLENAETGDYSIIPAGKWFCKLLSSNFYKI